MSSQARKTWQKPRLVENLMVGAGSSELVVETQSTLGETKHQTLGQFYQMLSKHDWYFMFSDDSYVYRAGQDSQKRLDAIAKQSPSHQALLDGFVRHYFPGDGEQIEEPPLPVKPQ
jgi:hypothetical protein